MGWDLLLTFLTGSPSVLLLLLMLLVLVLGKSAALMVLLLLLKLLLLQLLHLAKRHLALVTTHGGGSGGVMVARGIQSQPHISLLMLCCLYRVVTIEMLQGTMVLQSRLFLWSQVLI